MGRCGNTVSGGSVEEEDGVLEHYRERREEDRIQRKEEQCNTAEEEYVDKEKAAEDALFSCLAEKKCRGREREKRKMLTHIFISIWCQRSVHKVSCCLVTLLHQQC